MGFGEPEIREAVRAMIAQVEGRPCVNFGWFIVYEPGLVARSMAGDHSWVKGFLETGGNWG